jgi:hypothetical protein
MQVSVSRHPNQQRIELVNAVEDCLCEQQQGIVFQGAVLMVDATDLGQS